MTELRFGAWVRARRVMLGMNSRAVAAEKISGAAGGEADYSDGWLRNIESGARHYALRPSEVEALAAGLKVPVEEVRRRAAAEGL